MDGQQEGLNCNIGSVRVTEKTYSKGNAIAVGSEARATRAPKDALIRILDFFEMLRDAFKERVKGAETKVDGQVG